MRKKIFTFLTAILLFMLNYSAFGQELTISVPDINVNYGDTESSIVVNLDNISNLNENVASMQMTFNYDATSGIHINGDYELTDRTQGYTLSISVNEDGINSSATVLLFNMSGGNIEPNTGAVFEISFDIDELANNTTLQLSDVLVADVLANSLAVNYTEEFTFTMEEESPYLILSSINENVTNESGNLNISFESNVEFTIENNASWLTALMEENNIVINYEENILTEERIAIISVNSDDIETQTITIIQSGAEVYLILNSINENVTNESGNLNISFESNVEFTIENNASWLTALMEENNIVINYEENILTEERIAIISVNSDDIETQTITIIQSGAEVYLILNSINENVTNESGNLNISFESNVEFTIENNASWLTALMEENNIVINYEENILTEERIAIISVNSDDIETQTITIIQSGSTSGNIITSDYDNIFIYPNPIKNILFIKGNIKNANLKIYNLQGQLVLEKILDDKKEIDISKLEIGFYTVKIQNINNVFIEKLIKK